MIKARKVGFIEISVTDAMRSKALEKSKEMGRLKDSIMKGARNEIGFIGEQIVNQYFLDISLASVVSNTYDFDVLVNDMRIDVKTKDTTVYPKSTYDVSVADYNIRQKCDYYVFARVLDDMSVGWVLGYMPKKEYFQKARFVSAGQYDFTNGYTAIVDCWNMLIHDLKPIDEFLKEL